jgi:formate dehydrogenase major subunit
VGQCEGAGDRLEFPRRHPQHREPLYSPRPDLVAKYPTHDDKKAFWRLPTLYKSVRRRTRTSRRTSAGAHVGPAGRVRGGGDETRSNPWLAELQQENFIEINPKDANDRGVRDGEYVWAKTPTGAQIKVKAMVTERVGPGTTFIRSISRAGGRDAASRFYPRVPLRSCAARRSTPRRPTATTRSR